MQLEQGTYCPLVNGDCKKLACVFFTKLAGHNPNTGQAIEEWDCAIKWIPLLLIENSQMQRATGAAVESFRNEVVKANEVTADILRLEHH